MDPNSSGEACSGRQHSSWNQNRLHFGVATGQTVAGIVPAPQQQQQSGCYSPIRSEEHELANAVKCPSRRSASPCPVQQTHFQHQQQQHAADDDCHFPRKLHSQQFQTQERLTTTSTRAASPTSASLATGATSVAVASTSEAEWVKQHLSDMQRLRNSMNGGQLSSLSTATKKCTGQAVKNDNQHNSLIKENVSNSKRAQRRDASSPSRQSRHRVQHLRCRCHRRPSSLSSGASSNSRNSADSSSFTRSGGEESSSMSASMTSQSASPLASADPASKKAEAGGSLNDAGNASIQSVYANFLSVSHQLSTLIAQYSNISNSSEAGAALLQQQQQQPAPQPPARLVSLAMASNTSKNCQDGAVRECSQAMKALILPSPIRRSLSNKRNKQEMQPVPPKLLLPPPRPLPPLPGPLVLPQQQQQQQQILCKSGKDHHSKSSSRRVHSKSSMSQQSESSSNNRGLGFSRRIRASLSKKLSPRLRNQYQRDQGSPSRQLLAPQLGENLKATAMEPGYLTQHEQQQKQQQCQSAAAGDDAVAIKEAAELSAAAAAVLRSSAETPIEGALSMNSRVTMAFGDRQSADANLLKLQRLRSTILDLVQRSVDPVLKSLRNIQSNGQTQSPVQHSALSKPSAASEVTTVLSDVLALMELLSRSVMLVSMHNLDPNSIKLVYLSSSYIRSLKRLSKGVQQAADTPYAGVNEKSAAGDAERDSTSRLEV